MAAFVVTCFRLHWSPVFSCLLVRDNRFGEHRSQRHRNANASSVAVLDNRHNRTQLWLLKLL
jgi:hypothetical protein